MEFRWNEWNVTHIAEHGVTPEEAEAVVLSAAPPYPESRPEDKWLVMGRTSAGRYLQVIFVEDEPAGESVYIIHARPLTDREKKRYRKRIQ